MKIEIVYWFFIDFLVFIHPKLIVVSVSTFIITIFYFVTRISIKLQELEEHKAQCDVFEQRWFAVQILQFRTTSWESTILQMACTLQLGIEIQLRLEIQILPYYYPM